MTAHDARTIRANWGYVRPEKQTVEDQGRSATTVAKTVAKPLNSTRRTWTTLEYRPSPRPVTDGPGRLAHSYGSEGWGFESLRARHASAQVRALFSGVQNGSALLSRAVSLTISHTS